MAARAIKVLMAGSPETGAAIEEALREHDAAVHLHRVDNRSDLMTAFDAHEPHLVFTELELPDFSALDLTQSVRGKDADTPIILIRGTGADAIAMECMTAGAVHCIEQAEHTLKRLPALIDACLAHAESNRARRQLEKRLVEAEERYLDIFDNTSDLIQCLAPDGSFLYTNQAWRKALGYTEEEVKTLKLTDVLHPDSMPCCRDRFERLKQGESLSCIDFKFISKSGETLHLYGDCGSIIKDGRTVSTRGIFRNMTDAIKAEAALRRSEARYQALYENAPDIYTTIDTAGTILSINRVGARMLGYEVDELIGESAAKVIHPEDQRAVFGHLENQLGRDREDPGIEYRKIRKDGSILWVHQRVTPDPGAEEPKLFVVCRDITDRRRLEQQLEHQASHDTLTNLINRREFERRLQRLLTNASDPVSHHALCFLDLDQFKAINDTCGHIAGDELLRQIAALLQGQMRARDTLARFGGDEFAVLMEYCPLENAVVLAETLRETVENFQFHWRSHRFSLGVSIGVVAIRPGQNMIDTLTLADAACYSAKNGGRNRVYAHAPEHGS